MRQDHLMILLYQFVLIIDIASIAAFIITYTKLAPWWKNPIGRTIVVKDLLLILILAPSVLSLFFSFNRLTSHVASWIDLILLGSLAPVMLWRIAVWERIHREKSDADQGP
jgi:hypothetical protein